MMVLGLECLQFKAIGASALQILTPLHARLRTEFGTAFQAWKPPFCSGILETFNACRCRKRVLAD